MTSVLYLILTSLFGALNNPTDPNAVGDTIEGIFWFVTFIIWTVGVIVLPIAFYYDAITTQDNLNPIMKGTIGILMFIFGILITVKAYYMIPTFTSLLSSTETGTTFQLILFWVGLIINWAATVIIFPFYLILEARQPNTPT